MAWWKGVVVDCWWLAMAHGKGISLEVGMINSDHKHNNKPADLFVWECQMEKSWTTSALLKKDKIEGFFSW